MRHSKLLLLFLLLLALPVQAKKKYTDALSLTVVGKFLPTAHPWDRMDPVEGMTPGVLRQARQSNGLAVAFKTDSPTIGIRSAWRRAGEGVSIGLISLRGFDLYIKKDGQWLWAGNGYAKDDTPGVRTEVPLLSESGNGVKECMIYLPLYSEIESLEIVTEEDAWISPGTYPFKGRIAVFGSSYTQGSGAGRCGMAWTSQLSRKTGYNFINLGFSGNSKLQAYFAHALARAEDVDAYLFDGFSNPSADMIRERLEPFIQIIREARPGVPLIFLNTLYREKRNFNATIDRNEQNRMDVADEMMRQMVRKYPDVYWITTMNATSPDHETTSDGSHPNSYGYTLWAESIKEPVVEILEKYKIAQSPQAVAPVSIPRRALPDYRIVYAAEADPEIGADAAARLRERIHAVTGMNLSVVPDTEAPADKEILVGETNRPESAALSLPGPFAYASAVQGEKLLVKAGGAWALDRMLPVLEAQLKKSRIPANFRREGTVEGDNLFPREKGVNLRILDDNIWQYDAAYSPAEWWKAGLECTNKVRGPQFAQLLRAYMPDVASFQEVSNPMKAVWDPLFAQYGYEEAFKVPEGGVNFTPIYYRPETVELLDAGYVPFTPEKWNNGKTKSFSWAVCRLKANQRAFLLVSTHLWWKSEKAAPGSDQARAEQARRIIAAVDSLKAKYDVPVFVVGDLNANESKPAIQAFKAKGYQSCAELATHLTDGTNGHHPCGPHAPGIRKGMDLTRDMAIDHLLLYDRKQVEIRNFICEKSLFTIQITDHCPNILDVVL